MCPQIFGYLIFTGRWRGYALGMRVRHHKSLFSLLTTTLLCVGLSAFTSSSFAEDQTAEPETVTPAANETPVAVDPAAEAAAAASPDHAAETEIENPIVAVPNSKALDESSLSNPSGRENFNRPLLFDPADNGLQPDNPQIKWDIDPSGNKINLGGLKLSSSMIGLHIDQTKRTVAADDMKVAGETGSSVINFSLTWPTILIKGGTVSIEALDHHATWSLVVTEEMRAQWRKKLSRYKLSFLKSHLNSTFGFADLPPSAIAPFREGAPFRACLTQTNSDLEKLHVCTEPYSFQKLPRGRSQILPVPQTVKPNVSLGDKAIGPHGLVSFPLGKEVDLRITFANGSQIEIASQPAKLSLLDVVESKDGREIVLTGRLAQPLGKKKIVERPASHFWAATGVDQDTIWQMALPKDTPTLRILGAFNLPFTFLFRYEKIPTEADRVFVRDSASTGTYSEHPLLYGYSEKGGGVSSTEESATKTDDHHFEWTFAAPDKGARNKARITLLGPANKPGTWVAHHRLYRGFPFEASARLSGVIGSSGEIILIGEAAASAWLESLGFTQSDLISRQRWGLTARYFRTLTSISSSATGQSVSGFSVINADLKYNIVRGIWNRDQLFGVMGSLEQVSVLGLNGTLAGGGLYWARTMPKIFSELFDHFPLLDYSKYVDVEFVAYPFAASSETKPGTSFALNFHGKVFWTPRLYGEAGFGFRQYSFQIPAKNQLFNLSTGYGNIGVGIIF